MKLSVLILSTFDRALFLDKLNDQINSQLTFDGREVLVSRGEGVEINRFGYKEGVEVLVFWDKKQYSIGKKRNDLLGRAQGDYLDFIDDDDRISDNYFKRLFGGIEKGVDCCSLKGIIYENNSPPRYFEHSLRYYKYETVTPDPDGFSDRKYLRFPNHLNCIKSSIAKQFKFPEINHGEDTDFATQVHNSGLLKTEHYIDEVLYYYTPSDTRR